MEEELRIGIGRKRTVLGAICLMMAIATFHMINVREIKLAADSEGTALIMLMFILGFSGIALLLDGCVRTYKVDHRGITTYYFKIFDFFVPWENCTYVGMEKRVFPYIVCIRDTGEYALNIPFNQRIFEEFKDYVPEHMRIELWKDEERQRRSAPDASGILLKDTQGEMVINTEERLKDQHKINGMLGIFFLMFGGAMVIICFLLAQSLEPLWLFPLIALLVGIIIYTDYQYYGRNIIINREGITTITHRGRKRKFYPWQDFYRIGVDCVVNRKTDEGFWIFCRTKRFVFPEDILIAYTKERYEQLLTYVPEGLITDPPTQMFEIEWKKRHKY